VTGEESTTSDNGSLLLPKPIELSHLQEAILAVKATKAARTNKTFPGSFKCIHAVCFVKFAVGEVCAEAFTHSMDSLVHPTYPLFWCFVQSYRGCAHQRKPQNFQTQKILGVIQIILFGLALVARLLEAVTVIVWSRHSQLVSQEVDQPLLLPTSNIEGMSEKRKTPEQNDYQRFVEESLRRTTNYQSPSNNQRNTSITSMPMPKPKKIAPFAAWAQYLGKEEDHDFIEWKKHQVGEPTEPLSAPGKQEGSMQGKGAAREKENQANNGQPNTQPANHAGEKV
jgi:hypothetical protein